MSDICYEPLLHDMTWSFSRLNIYKACPHQWYLHYLMDEPEHERFYSSYGSFCHELIARFYTGELSREELLPEFLCGFPNRVLGERPSEKIERRYLDQGADYFAHFEPFPYDTLLVEQPVDFTVSGLKFTGVIDWLGRDKDGSLVLIDHKSADLKPYSGRGKPTMDDFKLRDTLRQLYLYCFWIKEQYGAYPGLLILNCFRTGKQIAEIFSPSSLDEAAHWVRATYENVLKDSDFLPTDDYYYCRYICPQHENCALYQEEYGRGCGK